MKLVITEKPSVAQAIAKVIGAAKHCDGYFQGNGYLVSWCVGHLIELEEPQAYDKKYERWKKDDLPIMPEDWKYKISASTRKQFENLQKMMRREDVTGLVNACDAGREGELIFRLVYHQAGCKKPFQRLWISSMEDSAIKEGFANLKPSTEYDALYEAALCRERADWIVGMNVTRLFSCLYGQTLNVGRVMTPTLAMVVMRDAEIAAFRSQPFYTVQINASGSTAASRRFDVKADAEHLLAKCKETMKAIVKSVDRKEKIEHAPLLYDLTSLQRDANRICGFTAQQTLDYTQALYEKKLVTYPRTDSRYLTNDMQAMLPNLLANVTAKFAVENAALNPDGHANVFDSSKVSDHHAIIPTRTMASADLSALPSGEKAILQLIAVRLMCAFAPDHKYAEDTVVLTCGGEEFTWKGKTILKGGWKDIWNCFYPAKEKQKDANNSMHFTRGALLDLSETSIKDGKTTAPKRFTEDTLLSAMETAGADDIPEDAERKGLGTPATRAGIIEKLVQKGFIERKGDKKTRYLVSTDKGNSLITVMPEQIQSASMTADWEQKLLMIEQGDYEAEDFMREIDEMITTLVANYEVVKGADTLMTNYRKIGDCPCCQSAVLEKQKGWFCSNKECKFALWRENAFFKSIGKKLSFTTAEKLLTDGRIRLKDCKSQKTGKTYNAFLILSTEADGKAKFRLEFDNTREAGKSSKGGDAH